MKEDENVYKLENAVPIQNTENKIEYFLGTLIIHYIS